jgi:hypothetical protein
MLLTATLLVFLSTLPMPLAATNSQEDAPKDLLLYDHATAPANLQEQYSYLDFTTASFDCTTTSCTFVMVVRGVVAPTISDPVIKFVRYVWRFYDIDGKIVLRVYYDWSRGWTAGVDYGTPSSIDAVPVGNTLTITLNDFQLPSGAVKWNARAWLSNENGKCGGPLGVRPPTSRGCIAYIGDYIPWTWM